MIKISYLGDIMFDNNMANMLENYRDINSGELNFDAMFVNLKPVLEKSDFVLANLETPITDDESDLTNKQWEFCTHYKFAEAIKKCGVHYVSTANNHCLDRGLNGIRKTEESLNKIGLLHSGINLQGKHEPIMVDVKGVKLGILAYTYGTNAFSNKNYLDYKHRKAVNLLQEQEGALDRYNPWEIYIKRRPRGRVEFLKRRFDAKLHPENVGKEWFEKVTYNKYRWRLIKKDIRALKRQDVDLRIGYIHIGGQYNKERSQYTLETVERFWKNGCRIVICNHEHVVHGCLWNADKQELATYALGNVVGSAGTLKSPYDRYAEYSIMVHTYIDEVSKKIVKITYSVLKSILTTEKRFEVWPVYDLLENIDLYEKDKLKQECLAVAKIFSNISHDSVVEEFSLWDNKE